MTTPFIWSEGLSVNTDSIDVLAEVARILEDHGHYMFLRKIRAKRAPSWDSVKRQADFNDAFNIGHGMMYDDYLVRTRQAPTLNFRVGPEQEMLSRIGFIGPSKYVFYLTHPPVSGFDVVPTMFDQLVQVALDDTTGLPELAYRIEKVFDINQVHGYRDRKGRLEYWSVLASEQTTGK